MKDTNGPIGSIYSKINKTLVSRLLFTATAVSLLLFGLTSCSNKEIYMCKVDKVFSNSGSSLGDVNKLEFVHKDNKLELIDNTNPNSFYPCNVKNGNIYSCELDSKTYLVLDKKTGNLYIGIPANNFQCNLVDFFSGLSGANVNFSYSNEMQMCVVHMASCKEK